jgi:hypothetical protein
MPSPTNIHCQPCNPAIPSIWSDPDPRTDFFEDDVGGNLQQAVTPEEGAGGQAIDVGAQAKIAVHRQCREADIDAIDVAKDVQQEAERHHAQIDFSQRCLFEGRLFRTQGLGYVHDRRSPARLVFVMR